MDYRHKTPIITRQHIIYGLTNFLLRHSETQADLWTCWSPDASLWWKSLLGMEQSAPAGSAGAWWETALRPGCFAGNIAVAKDFMCICYQISFLGPPWPWKWRYEFLCGVNHLEKVLIRCYMGIEKVILILLRHAVSNWYVCFSLDVGWIMLYYVLN